MAWLIGDTFPIVIGLVALGLIFSGGVAGLLIGRVIHDRYLDEGTQKIVQIAMGTVSVMCALVISLLITTARNTLNTRDRQVAQLATNLILLDRDVVQYGPEALDIRGLLQRYTRLKIQLTWPDNGSGSLLDDPKSLQLLEDIQQRLRDLRPATATQRAIQASALQTIGDVIRTRWLLAVEHGHEVPRQFLYILVLWLTALFMSFGVFAPRNAMVVGALFICAACLSTALLLIADMDQPLQGGIITIGPEPMQRALERMTG
jgi:hypothetical protein